MGGPSAERSETAHARPRPRTQPRSVEEGNHGDRPRIGIRSAKVSKGEEVSVTTDVAELSSTFATHAPVSSSGSTV